MAKGTFRLDKIWENFVENEMDTIGAFRALEVEKGLLTIKPQDFFQEGSLPENLLLPKNVKRKLGCYCCNIFFVNNFAAALVQSISSSLQCPYNYYKSSQGGL